MFRVNTPPQVAQAVNFLLVKPRPWQTMHSRLKFTSPRRHGPNAPSAPLPFANRQLSNRRKSAEVVYLALRAHRLQRADFAAIAARALGLEMNRTNFARSKRTHSCKGSVLRQTYGNTQCLAKGHTLCTANFETKQLRFSNTAKPHRHSPPWPLQNLQLGVDMSVELVEVRSENVLAKSGKAAVFHWKTFARFSDELAKIMQYFSCLKGCTTSLMAKISEIRVEKHDLLSKSRFGFRSSTAKKKVSNSALLSFKIPPMELNVNLHI